MTPEFFVAFLIPFAQATQKIVKHQKIPNSPLPSPSSSPLLEIEHVFVSNVVFLVSCELGSCKTGTFGSCGIGDCHNGVLSSPGWV